MTAPRFTVLDTSKAVFVVGGASRENRYDSEPEVLGRKGKDVTGCFPLHPDMLSCFRSRDFRAQLFNCC
ncbi:hypothetical protein B5X24_HaOG204081 [Helicoverpa armigera]|uniref:Uncharacterized protein n=1 Tax=Helicoverpa armigera TaxID=29058 RepID=A0A2W1BW15_HELAM|nr:hypothetical protein B5X24_HaOG204081 [Helicoverpa armigera]